MRFTILDRVYIRFCVCLYVHACMHIGTSVEVRGHLWEKVLSF